MEGLCYDEQLLWVSGLCVLRLCHTDTVRVAADRQHVASRSCGSSSLQQRHYLTSCYVLTNWNPSQVAGSRSSCREIPRLLWNRMFITVFMEALTETYSSKCNAYGPRLTAP
jgi:hypothetical protein